MGIEVSPNPFGDELKVHLSGIDVNREIYIYIYSMTGQLIQRTIVSQSKITIDTNLLVTGKYIFVAQGSDGVFTCEIFKN